MSLKPTSQSRPVPPDSLLDRLARARSAYADAYALQVPGAVSLPAFVEAFYTSRLFKAELALISLLGKPSSDAMARAVARGEGTRLAVWRTEARTADELLMQDDNDATRSWFKVEAVSGGTVLWFGSAIVPRRRGPGGEPQFSPVFHLLLGFHRWYSHALLSAAARRL